MLAPIRIDDNLSADFSSPLFTCIQRGGWYELQYAQLSHPPTHWHAETCH